jgi:sortase A
MITGVRWLARPALAAVSVVSIAAGAVIAVHVWSFLHNSSAHGSALIRQERRAVAARAGCRAARRAARQDPRQPRGLLEVPALGLVAPVEQGTGSAVLNDAVGHVRASSWPGHPGTAVFSAHDVTWFSGISRLRPGDVIRYASPCGTYTYRVTAHRVVRAGYPVYNTVTPSLVLDTCYPLDALYLTQQRYLVYANLVAASPAARPVRHRAGPPRLAVPAPPALAAQGLGLRQNEAPLGTLSVAGSPSPGWRQGNAPLRSEAAALAAYFGVLRSAEQGRRGWWADLAPAVPVPAAAGLWGGQVSGYGRRLDVRLLVRGGRTVGAVLTTVLTTAGSARPGTYRLRVTETATQAGTLLVTGFSMRPGS